MQSLTA